MIASKSEFGYYRYDGDADMKALRSRAEVAVRYFKTRDPKYETEIFGCPVSAIENGKLIDGKAKIMANTVSRYLKYYTEGFYKGRLTLSYHDMFNDGRGNGGSGGVILEDVKDVRIEGDYLIIEGLEGMPRPKYRVTYRYRLQDAPDTKAFTKPIKKGEEAPPAKPLGFAMTRVPFQRDKTSEAERDDSPKAIMELAERLHDIAVELQRHGQWYVRPYTGERLPMYTAKELFEILSDPDGCHDVCDMFIDCELSRYSEYWTYWSDYGLTYEEWKGIQRRLRFLNARSPRAVPKKAADKPVEKTVPKPASKPVPKVSPAFYSPPEYGGRRLTQEQIVSAFAEPVRCRLINKGWTVWLSMKPARNPKNWVDVEAYRLVNGEKRYGMGTYSPEALESDGRYVRIAGNEILWYRIEEELNPAPADKPVAKPVLKKIPKKAPSKPVKAKKPLPEPKPRKAPVKPVKAKPAPKKGSIVYEVRVDGRVEGEFSSKSKAESLKKQLKASGDKARIYAVFA